MNIICAKRLGVVPSFVGGGWFFGPLSKVVRFVGANHSVIIKLLHKEDNAIIGYASFS